MTPDNEQWIMEALRDVRTDVRAIRKSQGVCRTQCDTLLGAQDKRLRAVEQGTARLGVKVTAILGGLWIAIKLLGDHVADWFRGG